MPAWHLTVIAAALMGHAASEIVVPSASAACAECHARVSPGIVQDWRLSRHAGVEVACVDCHGREHTSANDAARASLPTPATCAGCHPTQVAQFERGKHARAWAATKAIPTFHNVQGGATNGPTGCPSCHRIGLKPQADTEALGKAGAMHGQASCDACHTRHLFSVAEAQRPEACRNCHSGGEHMQWEAWTGSKHGIRNQLVSSGVLPAGAAAPKCQGCHMPQGDHAVRAPWGSLGMRLPLPEEPEWARDRATLFRALGVLDANRGPGPRLRAVMDAEMAQIDKIDYDIERGRLEAVCRGCHAQPFVREQLDQRDALLRDADHTVAEAVRLVAPLFERGMLPPTANGRFPDLVVTGKASPIERVLAEMFFDLRARVIANGFHMSPAYVEARVQLRRSLEEIRSAAELARRGSRAGTSAASDAQRSAARKLVPTSGRSP